MEKMNHFRACARTLLACYADLSPKQQDTARIYLDRKLCSVQLIQTSAASPGGELAAELLQKIQQTL